MFKHLDDFTVFAHLVLTEELYKRMLQFKYKFGSNCPLCNTFRDCNKCTWMLMQGRVCVKAQSKHFIWWWPYRFITLISWQIKLRIELKKRGIKYDQIGRI